MNKWMKFYTEPSCAAKLRPHIAKPLIKIGVTPIDKLPHGTSSGGATGLDR